MPDPTSSAAVVADTILRTVEQGVTITNPPHNAETAVLHYLLDHRRRRRGRVRTGQIGHAGPGCPIWTVLQ